MFFTTKRDTVIPQIPTRPQPKWLTDIAQGDREFRLRDILEDSLYYPACGLNGTPIKYLAGNVHSFVYADYMVPKNEYLRNINGTDADSGCSGYHTVLQREIFQDDIVPRGWTPLLVPRDQAAQERILWGQRGCEPFGHWSVWRRDEDKPASHGPDMFSLLYLGGEMSAVYQGLYCRLGISPAILAIISPGALGGEWEGVPSNDSFFKKSVQLNPAGMPGHLIYGGFGRGFYEYPCWTEYHGERIVQLPERYAGLWKFAGNGGV